MKTQRVLSVTSVIVLTAFVFASSHAILPGVSSASPTAVKQQIGFQAPMQTPVQPAPKQLMHSKETDKKVEGDKKSVLSKKMELSHRLELRRNELRVEKKEQAKKLTEAETATHKQDDSSGDAQ